ncbi:uncharacterized protein BYT42DRAFT_610493 [Radiomyces spectabilis]|uniref:uncharacterized protein n=1 Tax=Radiomyces spectabilis TaxID=64574 RepID=UPI00221EB60B|nr:uncharacterized protein BYT42DRAFT_610493 [Radiomyces spectabilis]KAI8391246.1 hypothetical protein BYT42DRAFT_610493 [Radiomyces spectabilis]
MFRESRTYKQTNLADPGKLSTKRPFPGDSSTSFSDLEQEYEDNAFAAAYNHQLAMYWSFREDPFAIATDAFNQHWTEERLIYAPSMEIDSPGNSKNEAGQDQRSHIGNPPMDEPILAPQHPTSEDLVLPVEWQVNRRWSLIAWRLSTTKEEPMWCREEQVDPEDHQPGFSADDQHLLNGYGSAIASYLKVIHPPKPPIAGEPDMVQFFKATIFCAKIKTDSCLSFATIQ